MEDCYKLPTKCVSEPLYVNGWIAIAKRIDFNRVDGQCLLRHNKKKLDKEINCKYDREVLKNEEDFLVGEEKKDDKKKEFFIG